MNIKQFFNSLLTYTPSEEYNFDLSQTTNSLTPPANNDSETLPLYSSLEVNKEFIQSKYNLLINSDIKLREFTLNARGKQYNAILLYIDGMIESEIMNEFILKPLMLRNKNNLYDGSQNKIISEAITNNITVRKVKKFDLNTYIMNCLLPQNSVEIIKDFSEVFSGINSGNCTLFIDTLNIAFDIEVKGFKQRSVDKPSNEMVIKGPHEAFVENIRTNTSLIRRIINNENLVIENLKVGKITKTNCALFYLSNITNSDLIAEVKYRINNLGIDALISSGQLEQLISDSNKTSIPQILSTERPDKAAAYLLNGRVIVIVNGSPYAIIMPAVLNDFFNSPDDKNLLPPFANFVKFLRIFACFITLLVPGMYIAITNFHQELLPTELLFSILSLRSNVPFPILVEILLMEFSFELIREAEIRIPSPLGPTIGIVGALILGEAAVSADIVSPILIIIVAITGIASSCIPDFSFSFHLRMYRFIFILLGYLCGFLGISLGIFVYLSMLSDIKSFGVPFNTGLNIFEPIKGGNYYLPPIWKREYRASFVNPKKEKSQEKISMKWKFKQP
ncbi:MAG: spore germination protein [Clostridia bacterium]|nr:spore germination protein [Clostridia bacterium]